MLRALFFLFLISFSAQARIDVVVNANATTTATISAEDVKNLYLGKKFEISIGHPLKLYMPVEKGLIEEFLAKVIKKTEREFEAYWRLLLFRGVAYPPMRESSQEELLNTLVKEKDSMGLVPGDTPLPSSLKVILKLY